MRETTNLSLLKIWFIAIRPFAYTASVLAVLLGTAIAVYRGFPFNGMLFLLSLSGVLLFHTAANLLNDCFDHQRGADTDVMPMSGAVVRGWLTGRQAFGGAMLCLAGGISCGMVLTFSVGWMVLWLGIAGTICALGYTTPRFCFKYSGLGDITIFLAFGVLPVFGSWWVQAQAFSWLPILWCLPLSMIAVAILHANNWRDLTTDPQNHCHTLATVLGPCGSQHYFRILVFAPFAWIICMNAIGLFATQALTGPHYTLLVFASFPLAWKLARTNPAKAPTCFSALMAKTAQLHLFYGLLLVVAFMLARLNETRQTRLDSSPTPCHFSTL